MSLFTSSITPLPAQQQHQLRIVSYLVLGMRT
ncbi:hypothetical protein GBAR_LOCUS17992 [Geodia barretti]|uniref:Uncharacterized protein n=1 Tax=Geodia barretti TaxID=519541 RepID=A0AA35SM99_GEOBA|nr:hypothetical protein GBAR_LOCUS17992 [Geodia barretti]